jgi:hypothetical protein
MDAFTDEEIALIRDQAFFRAKAQIARKVRGFLDGLHAALKHELEGVSLLVPEGFVSTRYQFVKGEHLEDFPYQYLDFPKHFVGDDKFTFRSLFWWGHHFIFALILEGKQVLRYKQNLLSRYQAVAGRQVALSLAPSPWDWNRGDGYTLDLTPDRRTEVAAVLSGRSFFKLARFVPPDDPAVRQGRLVELGRETLRSLLPIVTP